MPFPTNWDRWPQRGGRQAPRTVLRGNGIYSRLLNVAWMTVAQTGQPGFSSYAIAERAGIRASSIMRSRGSFPSRSQKELPKASVLPFERFHALSDICS